MTPMTEPNWAGALAGAFCFLAACELQVRANALLLEAERVEARGRNPPWARNLRRKGDRMRAQARALAPNVYDGEVI
jgi:hypothetical protein